MDAGVEEEITAFVRVHYGRLVRTAYLLCGDNDRAEDLVQTALVKTALAWKRLHYDEGVEHYVQRVLVNTFISARRRRSWWERPVARVVEHWAPDAYNGVDQRDELRRLLARLPARQRAAVVLRHYQDMSEEQTATAMGCSVGTVKSLSSRGLRSLRAGLQTDGIGDVPARQGAKYAH